MFYIGLINVCIPPLFCGYSLWYRFCFAVQFWSLSIIYHVWQNSGPTLWWHFCHRLRKNIWCAIQKNYNNNSNGIQWHRKNNPTNCQWTENNEKQPLNLSSFSLLPIHSSNSDLLHVVDRQTAKFLAAPPSWCQSYSWLSTQHLLAQRPCWGILIFPSYQSPPVQLSCLVNWNWDSHFHLQHKELPADWFLHQSQPRCLKGIKTYCAPMALLSWYLLAWER